MNDPVMIALHQIMMNQQSMSNRLDAGGGRMVQIATTLTEIRIDIAAMQAQIAHLDHELEEVRELASGADIAVQGMRTGQSWMQGAAWVVGGVSVAVGTLAVSIFSSAPAWVAIRQLLK